MKFALIIPDSPFLINPRTFPMLGPLYLSAVLKDNGHEVMVIDMTRPVFSLPLRNLQADIVGITATTPQFPEAVKILQVLKKRKPHQRVIIGGPHASVSPVECAEVGFDQIVVGEGETAMVKIAEGVDDNFVGPPFIENLDDIPFPDREAIDIHSYHYSLNGKKTASMMTSRGCPFCCAFCSKAPWGASPARFRSSKNVLQEAALLKEMGFEGINFYDDNLLLQKNRDWSIFIGLASLGMVYRCFSRSNLLDEESVQLMANTGCVEVLLGIESGSDRILKNINKGETREQHLKAIALLKKWGIRCKAACIVGLPGESLDTIRETESLLEEAEPDDVDFTLLAVYRGSPIYNNREQYDISFDESYDPYKTAPGRYGTGISTSNMTSEELLDARDYLESKFKRKELLK